MRSLLLLGLVSSLAIASCDIGKITVNTTSKVLERAQPGLKQESDYEMARQAIPGALKTVEGFWVVAPDNKRLIKILTEGYCQYGTAFVEDDWEVAKFNKDLTAIAYHSSRASNIFTRCLNYALKSLGSRWQKELFADPAVAAKLIKETGAGQRTPMMFAGLALGSIINHNLDRIEMIGYLSTVQMIMERIIELDKANPPADKSHAALPHVALGMLYSARPPALGGEPAKARAEFEAALQITDNKYLLPRTLMAFRVGKQTNDRKFFHEQLKQVLETAPSVWPEQRLANEVAHRRARRYLTKEKEIF
jgi:hypothetical protein